MKQSWIIFFVLASVAGVLLSGPPQAFAASAEDAAVIWTVSDGAGGIELFWYPLAGWPAGGFRLERLSGSAAEVVADSIRPSDEGRLGLLNPARRDQVRALAAGVAAGDEAAETSAFLRSAIEPAIGYALGLRAVDRGGAGELRYRLSGLSEGGKPLWSVESAPIDPRRPSLRPGAPSNLSAEQTEEGVALAWRPPVAVAEGPLAFSIVVERRSQGTTVELSPEPTVALRLEGDREAGYLDAEAPAGVEVTYRVTLLDLFGRPGAPSEVTLFVEDRAALEPPSGLAAAAEPGRVVLTWRAKDTAGTTGYSLERALYQQGPYDPRLERPLGAETNRFVDEDVRGGTAYHYRLRSLDRRGVQGEPSLTASAIARGTSAPKRPTGLSAEAGRTRVRLRWTPATEPIAGYLVERRTAGAWARLNTELGVEALFDDRFGPQDGGRLTYRIIAVGPDSTLSEPSAQLEVELPDSVPPPRPTLFSITGNADGIAGEFAPGAPDEATTGFLVVRGGSFEDPGLVIGEPLPGSARTFRDRYVRRGIDYWYRLVAVDAAGHRSEPSDPLRVRAPLAELPQPRPPRLELLEPQGVMRLSFDEPPAELSVWIERRSGNQADWLTIAGPLAGTVAVDVRPELDRESEYRLVYRAESGASGPHSEPALMTAPDD